MIYELPTRSSRVYRGKYPTRINSWSYSSSAAQKAIAEMLSMARVVHIELNDGRRYIADMKDLKPEDLRLGIDFYEAVQTPQVEITPMHPEYYEAMLEVVRATRRAR